MSPRLRSLRSLSQGLCRIQPLRGCRSYSVSIILCYPYKVHFEATYPLNIYITQHA